MENTKIYCLSCSEERVNNIMIPQLKYTNFDYEIIWNHNPDFINIPETKLSKNKVSISLGHRKITELFLKSNYDWALICEDDVKFNNVRLRHFIRKYKHNFNFCTPTIILGCSLLKNDNEYLTYFNSREFIFEKTGHKYGLPIYLINKPMAKIILDNFNLLKPYDDMLAKIRYRFRKKSNSLVTNPFLGYELSTHYYKNLHTEEDKKIKENLSRLSNNINIVKIMKTDYSKVKKNLDYKIFAIGYNKTATTSIHNFFRKNGLPSRHDSCDWKVQKFQCFSDNGDLQDYKKFYEKYPKSVFLLNTRRLDKWVTSRGKHYEFSKWCKSGHKYPSVPRYSEWLKKRHAYYKDILEFFQNDPSRLYIVNIDRENWLGEMAKMFSLQHIELHSNKMADAKIPDEFLALIKKMFDGACEKLNIKEEDKSSPLLIRSMFENESEYQKYKDLLDIYSENTYL